MATFVVLIRGINVGGNNKLPMKSLMPLLTQAGYKDLQYYIQTGNIVLTSDDEPTATLKKIIFEQVNFTPEIITLTSEQFLKAQANCPYNTNDGKLVHYYFCKNSPQVNQAKIDKYLSDNEQYCLINKVLYLHAPDGIGRSKLVANMESCIGTPATARNLNTINKISEMLGLS